MWVAKSAGKKAAPMVEMRAIPKVYRTECLKVMLSADMRADQMD